MDTKPQYAAQADKSEFQLVTKIRIWPRQRKFGRIMGYKSVSEAPDQLSKAELRAMLAEDQAQREAQGESNVAEIRLTSIELRKKIGGPVGRAMGALGINMFRRVHKVRPEKA